MNGFGLSFDNADTPATLYVQDGAGRYRIASPSQILAATRDAAHTLLDRGPLMDQPESVSNFLVGKLAGLEHEVMAVLFLDSRLKLIRYVEMFSGSLNQAATYPREIVKVGLRLNAGAVILAHNHPSGRADASAADVNITKRLKESLALVDIQVLDHIIIGGTQTFSLAKSGLV